MATGSVLTIPDSIRGEYLERGVQRPIKPLAKQAHDWLAARQHEFGLAKSSLEHAAELQKRYHDKHATPLHFAVGDQVLLSAKNIKTKRPHKKLDNKWMGPFTVTERRGKQAYVLNLPPSMKRLHPAFHVSLLETYRGRAGYQPPPVDDIELNEEDTDDARHWEIQEILTHFYDETDKCRKYKVRWLGWSQDHDSDLTLEGLENAQDLLEDYLQKKGITRDEPGDAPAPKRPQKTIIGLKSSRQARRAGLVEDSIERSAPEERRRGKRAKR